MFNSLKDSIYYKIISPRFYPHFQVNMAEKVVKGKKSKKPVELPRVNKKTETSMNCREDEPPVETETMLQTPTNIPTTNLNVIQSMMPQLPTYEEMLLNELLSRSCPVVENRSLTEIEYFERS